MEYLKLSNETIDLISDKIEALYTECGANKKDMLRTKLLLEEALLKYQSRFGTDVELYFRTFKIIKQTRFIIRIKSAMFDPFSLEENPMAFMIESIRNSYEGTLPSWRYRNLENEISFSLREKSAKTASFKIISAVLVSFLAGILCRMLIPANTLTAFANNYLDPLANAYAGMFGVMAVILIFCALVLSIVKVGDINTISTIGTAILKRYVIVVAASAVVATVAVIPLFKISLGGELSVAVKSIYDIVIGFFPQNLVGAFVDFNSIHIMIIGCMFGFSFLFMGQKADVLVRAIDEANTVAILTNGFLNKFIAIYVGLKIFTIVTASDFAALLPAGKMVLAILLAELLIFGISSFRVCRKSGLSFREFSKQMGPAFIVCLSSANFGATFSTMYDSMMALKADDDVLPIAINIGSVAFKPSCLVVMIFSSLFMAKAYNVEISVIWLLTAIVFSLIINLGVPNIPGAMVGALTMLFSQMGLPAEALALCIAINALLQFATVSVDAWALGAEIIILSKEKKELDKD